MPSFSAKIKSNPKLKKFVHRLIIPKGQATPRLWVKWFANPIIHKRGKNTVIRRSVRMDIFPFNKFTIGAGCIVESFSTINNGVGDVLIGDNVGIGLNNVIIGPVLLGNYVMLAQNVVISGLNHGYQDVTIPPRIQKVLTRLITVDDNVWIGANAVITAGVTIGKHAVIGAGSVVTRDIPSYAVAVGNPAKVIKRYNFDNQTWEKCNGI